ncbi:MAG: phosphatidylserine decarboxylase [Thermoplasmatota archaeon]
MGSLPVAAIICGSLYILAFPAFALIVLGFLFLISGVVLGLFFRDPERIVGEGVVSPADGRVTRVEMMRGRTCFVSIFMNVHNVHVNRMPWSGTILDVVHHPGGFAPAFNKDSDNNERTVTRFKTEFGTWEMTQIAGAVARRIVPYISPGDRLEKGDRFGLIRFGSRVDLKFTIPPGMELTVEIGQKVRAGSSEIASLKTNKRKMGAPS